MKKDLLNREGLLHYIRIAAINTDNFHKSKIRARKQTDSLGVLAQWVAAHSHLLMHCLLRQRIHRRILCLYLSYSLLIPIPFLYNQKFIFLFYVSTKCKYTAKNFGSKTRAVLQRPSSRYTFVHDTKHLGIAGIHQRIILTIVHD